MAVVENTGFRSSYSMTGFLLTALKLKKTHSVVSLFRYKTNLSQLLVVTNDLPALKARLSRAPEGGALQKMTDSGYGRGQVLSQQDPRGRQ